MDGAGQLPPALKQLAPILKHASQLQGQVPVMSYLCSLYAIQLGLKIKGNDPASKTFLFGLMDRLERQRNELGSALPQGPDQKAFATNFAVKVFGHADDEYRTGVATRDTAKNFYASTVFFEVLRQFDDPLPEEIENMRKYAKYSAVQITKAVKQATQDDSSFAVGGELDPFSAAAGFPTIPSSTGSPSMGSAQPPHSYGNGYGGNNGNGGGSPMTTQHQPHQAFYDRDPSLTQPTPYDGYAGGFDIPSTSPSSFGQPARSGFASPPPSSSPSAASHFPAMSPPPSHGFPPTNAGGNPYAPAPAASGSPQLPTHGAAPADDIDQLLALFPTVPSTSSASAPGSAPGSGSAPGPFDGPFSGPGGGGGGVGSGGGSPNMNWSSSHLPPAGHSSGAPSHFPPHGPSADAHYPPHGGAPHSQGQAWPSIPGHNAPSSTTAPAPAPAPARAPAPAPAQAPAPAPAPAPISAPAPVINSAPIGFTPTDDAMEKAQKYARFAVSALQFEDAPYAVQNLQLALALLTGKQYN